MMNSFSEFILFNTVRLTHFVQGRSPLNPFLEGPPQRMVPENLHSEAARQVIHHDALLAVLVVIP